MALSGLGAVPGADRGQLSPAGRSERGSGVPPDLASWRQKLDSGLEGDTDSLLCRNVWMLPGHCRGRRLPTASVPRPAPACCEKESPRVDIQGT